MPISNSLLNSHEETLDEIWGSGDFIGGHNCSDKEGKIIFEVLEVNGFCTQNGVFVSGKPAQFRHTLFG